MRQGAVGHVRLVEHRGHTVVEKQMTDPARQETEVLALRYLASAGMPVPEVVDVRPGAILMTLMPGDRLDEVELDERLDLLRESAALLRRLHEVSPLRGLGPPPDDASIIERYLGAGGPPLPLTIPAATEAAFCHGDWTDGNLLASGGRLTAIVDWERAHLGDPLRELSRAAWAASRKDPRSFDVMVEGYGADPTAVRAWNAIHAAELWLWFSEAGPPEYLDRLTAELRSWPVT
ncbi:aminoglycoside phosphotransferase family protein [Microbacterium sp. QXD-8]|uniref:Aminoglycoside phosphotransferase family protein n=1 Tax=Microbacterium psychrotolerans TaxID=3068321 RepID=A0ABU0Z1M7_9MICO|nr:aminoglycoside phosphotransferase family protein [Microbacterium sp. QXD-8]MDQ7878483.1 aminoglycoside phosphotransferase family protein [Microbacterium sp. QXD-8]